MRDICGEISKCEGKIEELREEILHDIKLKEEIELGKKTIYDEYPDWDEPSFRNGREWLANRIRVNRSMIREYEYQLDRLYEQGFTDDELEDIFCVIEINNIVKHGGMIHGIKL